MGEYVWEKAMKKRGEERMEMKGREVQTDKHTDGCLVEESLVASS